MKTHKIEPLPPDYRNQEITEEQKDKFRDDMCEECGLPRVHDKKITKQHKIKPLNIENYDIDIMYNDVIPMKKTNVHKAIRALFAKVNEVIYKLEEKEKNET